MRNKRRKRELSTAAHIKGDAFDETFRVSLSLILNFSFCLVSDVGFLVYASAVILILNNN